MAQLNFQEEELKKQGVAYDLYSRLYEGMRSANRAKAPSFPDAMTVDEDGKVSESDLRAVELSIAEYADVQMKNSAYLFANSIVESMKSGGSGGGGVGSDDDGLGYIIRTGDNMTGQLGALYGFQAGYNGTLIFETSIGADDKAFVRVEGELRVNGDTSLQGKLTLPNTGVWFGATQSIWLDNGMLNIANENINLAGAVVIDGSLKLGDMIFSPDGITWGDFEFYHKGNANNENTDWTMKDAIVYGDLRLQGDLVNDGMLIANNGFRLSVKGHRLMYSEYEEFVNESGEPLYEDSNTPLLDEEGVQRKDENGMPLYVQQQAVKPWVTLQTDLKILSGYGLKLDEDYIVRVRDGADGVVSFSAPGRVLNLGDSDGDKATKHIALQSSIKNYNGVYDIISQYGDGNFPNSFSAGSGNGGNTALRTYYRSAQDQGFVSLRRLRIGSEDGGYFWSDTLGAIKGAIPYTYGDNGSDGANEANITRDVGFSLRYEQTSSLFRDLSKEWSATLHFDTEGEFFAFDKPVESEGFSIKSEKYKTRLIENALFLNDGAFLEGLTDGIRYAGNSYFDGNLSSKIYSSGFAGSGWGIMKDLATGNWSGTLDELTLRKKLRAYEFEVQKISATNGSVWVSDSCSGDEVILVD